MQLRRFLLAVPAVLLVGSWVLACAGLAQARIKRFDVVYSGAGQIASRLRSQTSPQCGEVTEVRNETTHFSWVTRYVVHVGIGSGGLEASSALGDTQASALADNASTITLSDTGCQTAIANCKGESEPQPGHDPTLNLSAAAPGGRSRLELEAMGGFLGFTGKGFAGGWTFPTGSCGENFNRRQLLLPEFGIPAQLQARFPVKFQTLNSLPRGHYFRVRISAGHYARAHRNSCFAQGGCLKDQFSWKGVVTVTRKS